MATNGIQKRQRALLTTVCVSLFFLILPMFFYGVQWVKGQDTVSKTSRELERQLHAEMDYDRIQYEFSMKLRMMQKELKGQPDILRGAEQKLFEEENRILQHKLDFHGFERTEFIFGEGDPSIRESVLKKYPDLQRWDQMYHLHALIAGFPGVIQMLEQKKQIEIEHHEIKILKDAQEKLKNMSEQQKQEYVKRAHEELKKHQTELANLEAEEARFKYPRPKDELETFFPLELDWWDLKKEFLRKYIELTPNPDTKHLSRWQLVQRYRSQLQELMRSKQVQPVHYQEYQARRPFSLEEYVRQHSTQKARWEKLKKDIARHVHGFSLDQSQGMAMVVGLALGCVVPPVQCRGEHIEKSVPLSGIAIRITQTEGKLTLQEEPGSTDKLKIQRALPPSYRTKSDAKGRFVFPAVPVGEYDLVGEYSFNSDDLRSEFTYQGNPRRFYIESGDEVLILDVPLEKIPIKIIERENK